MKMVISMLVVALMVAFTGASTGDLDVEALVANKNSLTTFLGCFIDKNPCTELTQELKKKLPEVLQNSCAKCNPNQKQGLKLFLDSIKEKLPAQYAELKKKYDHENKLFDALYSVLASA